MPHAEDVSNPPAREKEGKEGPDTAARKRKSRKGKGRLKTKRVKQSNPVEEPFKHRKMKGDYHEEEEPASPSSSDDYTSSEVGEETIVQKAAGYILQITARDGIWCFCAHIKCA